jgi:3-deoxy-D-manno-octulosonate 8-phosphate phosphatase (KDO 8-P phosphatase)
MRRVGLGVAVANARPQVKAGAEYITAAPGGDGAIREVLELIMEAQGTWPGILEKYGAL